MESAAAPFAVDACRQFLAPSTLTATPASRLAFQPAFTGPLLHKTRTVPTRTQKHVQTPLLLDFLGPSPIKRGETLIQCSVGFLQTCDLLLKLVNPRFQRREIPNGCVKLFYTLCFD